MPEARGQHPAHARVGRVHYECKMEEIEIIKLADSNRNAFVWLQSWKLCKSHALQIRVLGREGLLFASPEVPLAAFVCSRGGPSGRREKLVISWLIGRLSRANKDICFLAEVLTNPNLRSSILSLFLYDSLFHFHYGEK